MTRWIRGVLALLLAAFLIWADLATKGWAHGTLRNNEPIPVIKGFWDFRYTENRDIGFSLLRFVPEAFRYPLIITLVFLGVIAVLVYGYHRLHRIWPLVGASFIVAGALGNQLNRLTLGFVVDFIHWYYQRFHWPIFNFADIYVVIGVSLLLICEWKAPEEEASAGEKSPQA